MLNHHLKEELIIQTNGKVIKDCKLFTQNFSEQFLRRLVLSLQQNRLAPNSNIFLKGDIDNPSIYFIEKGKVELFIAKSGFHDNDNKGDIVRLQIL